MMFQEGGTHAAAETLAGDDFRWRGRLRPGATLAIHNLSGNVRAVPAAGPDAEVRAEKHVRHGDPEGTRIERVEHAGGVTFCVLMPTEREGGNDCTAAGIEYRNFDSRATRADVHFTVAVPAGVKLHARALSGSTEGERLPGDVDAVTLSGSVRASAAGSVQATTLSGTLDVAMGRTAWAGTLALRSMSGTIRVRLPDNASTEVRASSMSGSIRSDFPLEVGRRSAQGTIGTGGRRLELQTMSGAIRLEREGATGTTAAAEARRLDIEEEWDLGLEESVSGFGAWLGRAGGDTSSNAQRRRAHSPARAGRHPG
jgi:hypothetical protein